MKRIHVLVEGQTEETFIREVLGIHLLEHYVHLTPILLTTKRIKSGKTFKGGVTSYNKIRRELYKLLKDSSVVAVTTMLDYYALPEDFPGRDILRPGTCYQRVQHLEQAFQQDVAHPRFIPFLMLHEFEALLFVGPHHIAEAFPERDVVEALISVKAAFASPEEINEGRTTHPSERIRQLVSGYRKRLHGALIANRIGLKQMRHECPHFDQWVNRLESLV
jgi:hypothetical protein